MNKQHDPATPLVKLDRLRLADGRIVQ